jgi:hypothetical protein
MRDRKQKAEPSLLSWEFPGEVLGVETRMSQWTAVTGQGIEIAQSGRERSSEICKEFLSSVQLHMIRTCQWGNFLKLGKEMPKHSVGSRPHCSLRAPTIHWKGPHSQDIWYSTQKGLASMVEIVALTLLWITNRSLKKKPVSKWHNCILGEKKLKNIYRNTINIQHPMR